jgi:hypothetical protein
VRGNSKQAKERFFIAAHMSKQACSGPIVHINLDRAPGMTFANWDR